MHSKLVERRLFAGRHRPRPAPGRCSSPQGRLACCSEREERERELEYRRNRGESSHSAGEPPRECVLWEDVEETLESRGSRAQGTTSKDIQRTTHCLRLVDHDPHGVLVQEEEKRGRGAGSRGRHVRDKCLRVCGSPRSDGMCNSFLCMSARWNTCTAEGRH